ncbi:MAG: selenium-dependent xanthine dehydrogenase [Spirochaetales bacterium]|nr:selenium-dependent xanthine dehydrogenase [Spirochaetales bacterium]
MIVFYLNGERKEYAGPADRTVLKVLREEYRVISLKDGCSGQAFCGACTIEADGKAILSCVTKMGSINGKRLVTLEGFDPEYRNMLAAAYAGAGAVQCGFCTPAYMVRTKVLLDNNPEPDDEQIRQAFRFHFCRCTGFIKIIRAVHLAAEYLRTGKYPEKPSPFEKYRGRELAMGRVSFLDDIFIEGICFGALRFSDHPRAVVKRIDSIAAKAMPGVLGVYTAADIPGERFNGLIVKDWPVMISEGECTAYTGDVLALVVAIDEAAARSAAEAIQVEYDVREPLCEYEQAESSPIKVHDGGNLLEQCSYRKGEDIDKVISGSAHTISAVFHTQRIEHAFLECEAAAAIPQPDGGLFLYSQSQGVYEDRRQLSEILALPEEKVRIRQVPTGGGFGGKEDLTVQPHACLGALLSGRPVKVKLTRDESFRMHPKRHPMRLSYTVACDSKGKLTALRAEIIGDTGAYASVGGKVLERAAGHAASAYFVPNVKVSAKALYTNNVPCGAMRGFGVNQAAFAMESCVDELCRLGGFDPWEFRHANALTAGLSTVTGQVLKGGVGVRACLEAIKPAYDRTSCRGIACGIKNTGIGNGVSDVGTVCLAIQEGGRVEVRHGWTEMGQGIYSVARIFVNKETQIPLEKIDVVVNTQHHAPAGMTTASRGTSLLGNALLGACAKLKKDLVHHKPEELAGREYTAEWRCDYTTKPGETDRDGNVYTHYSYGYAAQLAELDEAGKVVKITAAHDAGKIINPLLFEGQIEGSVHMGLGYALSEDFPCSNGYPSYTSMRQLGLIGIGDMPEVEVIGVEVPDPEGPLGAKGVGEIGLVPTAAAVANAFAWFDGERRYSLPLRAPGKTGTGGGNGHDH